MKKLLLTLALSSLTVAALRADVIFNEGFNYFDGSIIQTGTNANGTTNWFRHNGSANPSDAIVANHKLQNQQTTRADDVNRPFTSHTNSPEVIFASFTVNCTNLPTVTTYFAHFNFNNTGFHGRV